MKKVNSRQASIEMLRCLCMFMVVLLHALGRVLYQLEPFSAQYFICWFLEGIAFVAVNCYVLISGYFLVKSRFTIKKIFLLVFEVFIYSITIYIFSVWRGYYKFSKIDLLKNLFPISFGNWWFVTVYIGMYILSPFINIGIHAMSRKMHTLLATVMVLLFSVYPNVFFTSEGFQTHSGYSLIWFICLYVIAAWIRLYYTPNYRIGKKLIVYLCVAVMVPLSRFIIGYITFALRGEMYHEDLFYNYNSVLVLASSILLFLLFLNYKGNDTIMGRIALRMGALTFAVYLIHEHDWLQDVIWSYFDLPGKVNKIYFVPYIFFSVIVIYIVCLLIDCIRIRIFKQMTCSDWFSRLFVRLTQYCISLCSKFDMLLMKNK